MATYFVSNAGSNTAPYDTEAKAATSLGTIAALWTASDIVKISSTHTESTGGAITYTFPSSPGLQILSVTFNGSGTGALATGAVVTNATNGTAFNFQSGFVYCYGVTFNAASSNSNSNVFNLGVATTSAIGFILESCTLTVPGTGTAARLFLGPSASNNDTIIHLINCTLSNGADKSFGIRHGKIIIDGLTIAGTTPTTLFAGASVDSTEVDLRASDISNLSWTNLFSVASSPVPGYFRAVGCKFPASFVVVTGSFTGPGQMYVEAIDCNSSDVNYYYYKSCYEGTVEASNSIYADASDGTNSISWKFTSNSVVSYQHPLVGPPIHYFNKTLSSMQTVVEVVSDNVTYKDTELWQETMAKITSGSPVATWNRADRGAITSSGTYQTTSTVSWTGTGGFTSAVKQKLESGSFTPAEIGQITVLVKLAKASSTVYVSPKVLTSSPKQVMNYYGAYTNEATISTDPGIANVLSTANYTINDVSYTGSYVAPTTTEVKINTTFGVNQTGTYAATERYTDPGAANVASGTTYLFNAVTQTGTFSGGGATYTDPGTTNVRIGTSYIYNNVTQTGSLNVPTAASGTANTVDIGNIKETIRYVINEANTTTGSPIDLSGNLSVRVKQIMKVNPEKIRIDANQLPCVTVFANKKTVKLQDITVNQVAGKRRADLILTIVGMFWNDSTLDYKEDSADEDLELLMENVERVLRHYTSLNNIVNWQFPTDITYHTVSYDEQTHLRVGVMDLQVSLFY